MPSSYLQGLRSDLTDAIRERDTTGLTDAVAERINRLECLIAHEERRLSRQAARRSWLMPFVRWEVSHG